MGNSRTAARSHGVRSDVQETARAAVYAWVDPITRDHGVEAVAARMGMPAGTLYNKLNLHEENYNKLSVRDLIQICTITGAVAIVQSFCRSFGCVCFPVPNLSGVTDEALLELITNIGAEGGDFYRAVNAALARKHCAAKDIAIVHKEGMEFIGAIAEAMERTKGLLRT